MSNSHRDGFAFYHRTAALAASVYLGALDEVGAVIDFAGKLRDLTDDSLAKYERTITQAFKNERLRRKAFPIRADSLPARCGVDPVIPPSGSTPTQFQTRKDAA